MLNNEDIDLSDGFESTVHMILEYWKVLRYLTSYELLA